MSSRLIMLLVLMLIVFQLSAMIMGDGTTVNPELDERLDTISSFGVVTESTSPIGILNYIAAPFNYGKAMFELVTQPYSYMQDTGMQWVRNFIWIPTLAMLAYGLVMGFAAMISRVL